MSEPISVNDLSLAQLRDAADRAVTVATAAEVGLFTGLHAAGAATPGELAERLGLDARAVAMLLPALEQLRLVQGSDGRWSLTERGRRQLGDVESPEFAARGLPLWLRGLRRWTQLDELLRTGRAPGVGPDGPAPPDIPAYMAGMVAVPLARVQRTVQLCLQRRPGARTAIDLGGGPGIYARELARAGLDTVLFDTPAVIDYVREAYDVAREPGLRLMAGDLLHDGELPGGPFDLAFLSNVCHLFAPDEVRALFRQVAGVLGEDGVVAISETVRGRSPRAPWMGLMMILRGERGDAYDAHQYERWLREAGLQDVRVEDVEPDRQLITARRGG